MADLEKEKLVFDLSSKTYNGGAAVDIPENTNAILVVNIGTVLITVNGFPLNPALAPGQNGESWTMGGNRGEVIQRKELDIVFAAAGGLAFIQFKWYVKNFC